MLDKDGEDQLDRSCEKLRSVTYSEEEIYILHAICKRGLTWLVLSCVGSAFWHSLLKERWKDG